MATIKKKITEGGHWYRADGSPCHRMPNARGDGNRPTTIRDARVLNLFPSVTSILGILAKPQLEKWKMRQVALASMKVDRSDAEPEDHFADRIIDQAFEQVGAAIDLGHRIHDALEKHFDGHPIDDDLRVYTDPVLRWQQDKGLDFVAREKRVVNHAHGFAGTLDVACRFYTDEDKRRINSLPEGVPHSGGQRSVVAAPSDGATSSIPVTPSGIGVIDFKTRKTTPGKAVFPYDGQAMQIAAYAATYWGEESLAHVFGANVYISTTEPGRVEVSAYSPEQLQAEWEMFKMACALWRHTKNYDPRPRPATAA